MANKVLEVKNLKLSFRVTDGKVQAVRNISFDLYKGETLAIVGESGSGKSVTNRAIMGISAGNSIVESGEILYDGQDLLRISEEDFHKLRGDKIAMIFQDPMSSLNPIMKVGKQLTEAMLLKGKASQRNSRKEFNSKLSLLLKNMQANCTTEEEKKHAAEMCKTFDTFCINANKIERRYNDAHRHIEEAIDLIENTEFLIRKEQKFDVKAKLKQLVVLLKGSYNEYLVDDKYVSMADHINYIDGYQHNYKASENHDFTSLVAKLDETKAILEEVAAYDFPNFFRIGYYLLNNPDFDVRSMYVKELNQMALEYLDKNFMNEFLDLMAKAIKNEADRANKNKAAAIVELEEALNYFKNTEVLDKKTSYGYAKSLTKAVESSIDYLETKKDSIAYTFHSAIKSSIDGYFRGLANNPKEQARYDKASAKHQKIIDSGKTPNWNVIPLSLIDLDLAKQNIIVVIERILEDHKTDLVKAAETDYSKRAVELVDYFKELASKVVYKVTKKLAKVRAIKLLEEVGISNPAQRYNQYPFEFSGGMRQRIVIAIALAANPDILICDEPTTALDVTIQSQILELINKIKKERNLSVIFITHDLGVVANMADRIAVMYAGKIVETGTAEDVFYDPKHPYTWALLSSMPDLDTTEKLEAIPGTPPNMIYPPKGDAFAERNKYALKIDFEEQPPMFKVSDTHYAATWLLHPNAPKVNPPKIVTDRIERMAKRGDE